MLSVYILVDMFSSLVFSRVCSLLSSSLMIDFSHLIFQAFHGRYVCLGCTFASYTPLCNL